MDNTIHITGTISIKLYGADGKLKDQRTEKNLIVNTGRALIIDRCGTDTRSAGLCCYRYRGYRCCRR
jgi:hypothetical protein